MEERQATLTEQRPHSGTEPPPESESGPVLLGPRLSSGQQEVVRWIAISAMVLDHVGVLLVPPAEALPLRAIGRIAWPLFAFLLAYNVAVRRVDPLRYLKPLALWTLIAQLPHYLAFNVPVVSILGTLFLAAASLGVVLHRSRLAARSIFFAPLLLLLIVYASMRVEYGPLGVALVLAFWWALRSAAPLAWLVALVVTALANQPWAIWPYALLALPIPFICARLPLSLPRSGRLPWLLYPAHLAILVVLERLL